MTIHISKKTLIVTTSIILIALIIIGVVLITSKQDEYIIHNFTYGEKIEGVEFYDYKHEIAEDIFIGDNYTIVVNISSGCGSCIDLISKLPRLIEIYMDIDFKIVWNDNIPKTIIEKYDIASEINYSLKGKDVLDVQYPVMFLLDNDGIVRFKDIDMNNILDKVHSLGIIDNAKLIDASMGYTSLLSL